ncbi:type VII secretion target [Paractinoplanes lichenicola]|uniref:ESX-1 secretion-associated protein n=1 Tax=Paractinoplanes lichenicola TaxID=2802976 RepID=A0ABS1W1L4_9ACTN|nr:type VII secretion target [Actinoplanes lichenicola]MBL7260589.1 ESX-1 secretion-associated protein [Actinoplanes lichenicola]
MSDHVGVRPGELVTHAASVAAIGDRVDQAARAGSAVRAGPGSYGKLCLLVPAVLGALQDTLVDGITAAGAALHDTAARLRATAEGYDGVDRRRAGEFDRIRGGR